MRVLLSMTAVAVLASGCTDGVFAPNDERGWTVATVQGDVVSNYQGSGHFSVGDHYGDGTYGFFEIRSEDARHGGLEGLVFERFGGRLPTEGRYWIGEYDSDFFARYEIWNNGRWEWYSAEFGTLDIWSASSERLEGEFRFSAVLTCIGDGTSMECHVPPPANAPRIVVEGDFVAVRGSGYQLQ